MSKKVFKVGDRVKVINKGEICRYYKEFINKNAPKYINKFQDGFSPNDGSVGVVVGVGLNTVYRYPFLAVLSKGKVFCIGEKGVEPIQNSSIHITTDGTKVLAVMKQDKQEVGRGVATCNPSDEFDFKTGAKLAMDRLLGEEIKGDYVTGVREVSRKAKVGEYIRIVKKGNHGALLVVGDIHKVVSCSYGDVITDKGNLFHDSETHEYVVLENYNPQKAEPVESTKPVESKDEYLSFKKVKRRAEVGEYVLVVDAENVPGDDYKNGDIIKCISRDGYHEKYTEGMLGGRKRVLYNDEYVVLEGYQSPKSFENHADNTFTKEQVLKAVEKALEK